MTTRQSSDFRSHCPPQQFTPVSTRDLMLLVILCCLPGVALSTWFYGIGTLLNILVASIAAVAFEATVVRLRNHPVKPALADKSALVTAVLLGIVLPPATVWWSLVCAIFVAIVVAKHAYGGLGQNPFNPAMCGYAFLLLVFSPTVTTWQVPLDVADAGVFDFLSPGGIGASVNLLLGTATGSFQTAGPVVVTSLQEQVAAAGSPVFALLNSGENWLQLLHPGNGAGRELISLGYLAGGMVLIFRRVINWRIPVFMLITVIVLSLTIDQSGTLGRAESTYLQLAGTTTLVAAFFIATDPASSPSTPWGKILYGMVVGATLTLSRAWEIQLDPVPFAVLTGNLLAPLIDRTILPVIYGHRATRNP